MRITVVGAILIVAAVVAGVLLFLALDQTHNRSTNKENSDPARDQPLAYGTGGEDSS
jgi:hypothetical protein